MSTRPATLGSSLDLKTLADVDAALHELGWLQQQTAQVKARTQAAVDRLTAEANGRLQVEIDGQPVAFADRSKALEAALVKWCGAKLAKHLEEAGAQSLKLAHGVIGTRSAPDAVVCDEKAVLAAVEKRAGLAGLIAGLMQTVLGAVTLGNVIRLKPEVDKTAAKKAWAASPMRQKTLRSLGLVVETNRSTWVIEPAAIEVAAPAA